MTDQPMLETSGLSAGYGRIRALENVSITVFPGELVALIGANGAGKTTFLRTVSGMIRAKSGSVRYLGEDVTRLRTDQHVQRSLIHVPEGRALFRRMTVAENLRLGAYRRKDKAIGDDLARVFDYFPVLRERQSQLAGTLSGGEAQMLTMGRALMARPKLLLLDEPSLGLAPLIVTEIFEIIRTLNADGISILLVEQNSAAALKHSHRAYVMETGEIVHSGLSVELRADPRIREAYLGRH